MDSQVVDKLRRWFERDPQDAVAVYLFGSQARGQARPDSDVDVGILFRTTPPLTLLGQPFLLEADLEVELQKPVQIVVLNTSPPEFTRTVLRDGVLVLDRDKHLRAEFELRAHNEYVEIKPYLDLIRERRGVMDEEVITKRLALIEQHVDQLRTLAHVDEMDSDVREARFVKYTLQIAIQSAIDAAWHIAAGNGGEEPSTNAQVFEKLAYKGWVDPASLPSLKAMVGFRNMLVHGYIDVDNAVVKKVLRENLDDLLTFVAQVRAKLAAT